MKAFVKQLNDQAVEISGSRLGAPRVTYDPAERRWRLEGPFTYDHDGHAIHVPEGFEFDLATVPRPLWWLIAPFELSIAAPLIHDFLYRYRGEPPAGSIVPERTYSRGDADRLFRRMMKEEGVKAWRRGLSYVAVSIFGCWAWR
jgi:hypothetical protein